MESFLLNSKFFLNLEKILSLINVLTIVFLGGLLLVNGGQSQIQASSNAINLYPGQSIRLFVFYDNASDQDFTGNAKIELLIDERFEYQEGYLIDSYENQIRCVNDKIGGEIRTTKVLSGQLVNVIDYSPRTSGIAAGSGVCNQGGGVKGNAQTITLPRTQPGFDPSNQQTWRGKLEFRVRLKENVISSPYNLKVGDIIEPNINQGSVGIVGEFSLNNIIFGNPKFSFRVSGTVLSPSNVRNGTCLNQPVLIPEIAVCGFPLTGGNNIDRYILGSDFQIKIQGSNSSAYKKDCGINYEQELLVCKIPTSGASPGNNIPVNLVTSNGEIRKASINLVTNFDANDDFDKDGIINSLECGNEQGINCRDSDGDGISDWRDSDSDGDGIPDFIEAVCTPGVGSGFPCDSDGDGVPDYLDLDSDGDEIPDSVEKGSLTCNMELFPPTCINQLRDTNGNGIPNFRDPENGSLGDIKYFIDQSFIKFSFENASKPIWRISNLVLTSEISKPITDCEVKFRKYSSSDWWTPGETNFSDRTCRAVLKAEKQYTQKWDTIIILTDSDGDRWGAYPSYSMENGSVGTTQISARFVDAPEI